MVLRQRTGSRSAAGSRCQVRGGGAGTASRNIQGPFTKGNLMSGTVTIRPRVVRHVSIDSEQPYAAFRAAYETAVPAFDRLEAVGVVRSGAGWSGITALSDATAGNGLVNVFTFDPSPLMKLNDSTRQGVTYLAANIIRAERG